MTDYSKMSDEQLLDIMNNGGAQGRPDTNDGGMFQDIGQFLKENGEIPGGIGGALGGAAAGAALGSVVPVVGTAIGGIAGGVLGGALGSGAGSLASDAAMGRELDFEEAGREAAISVGIDALTFGAGKVLRPVARAIGLSDGGLTGLLRKKPEVNVADEIVDFSKIKANTQESMQATHKFLTERNAKAGLSAAQTGQSNFIRRAAQGLGDIGVFSSAIGRRQAKANNEVIYDAIQDLAGDAMDVALPQTTAGLGMMLHGAVEAGRSAARSLMDDGITKLAKEHGGRRVSTKPMISALRRFQNENMGNISNKVSKATLDKAQGLVNNLLVDAKKVTGAKSANLEAIIDFEKALQRDINKAMPNTAFSDPTAVKELTQLKKAVQKGVDDTLNTISPEAAATYRELNKNFSDTMSDLTPKKLGRAFAAADAKEFDTLGKMLLSSTNESNIRLMMKSLDKAYETAAKAKMDLTNAAAPTADAARKFIKKGYMEGLFKGVDEATDLGKFRNKALQLSAPDALSRAKAVLGDEDFNQYKRIVNAISDTSTKDGSNLFGLAMRQREVQALLATGAIGTAAGSGDGSTTAMTAGLILLSPVVLARLATNKQAVNHLLALNTQVKRGLVDDQKIAAGVARIFESMTEDDRGEIRSTAMRQ